jgi:MFS family permease
MAQTEFHKLWAASAASSLSDGITLVAAPLLAASLTRDPALVAGLAFAQRSPWLLFALLSGALADRLDRRRAMAAAAACRAVLMGGLGLAVVMHLASLPLVYGVFFLVGTGETLFDISAATLLPAIVPPAELPRANARLAGIMTLATLLLGPPLGALLFTAGSGVPFVLGSAGLAASAVLVLALRGRFKVEHARRVQLKHLPSEVAEGLRWLWRHQLLRTLSLVLGLLDHTLVAQNSIMVLFVHERLGLDAAGYGVLVSLYGVGGLLGSVMAHRLIARFDAGVLLRVAVGIETVYPLVLALSHSPVLAGADFALFGVHAVVWGALISSLRQELTPARLRGRVESAYRFVESGAAAPGALVGGLLAAQLGLTAPFWLGGITGLLLLAIAWPTFSPATVASARTAITVTDQTA